jgi:hypothetical protein
VTYTDPSVILYRWLEDNKPSDPKPIEVEDVEWDEDGVVGF